jgi:hypothetical protein
LCSGNFFHRLKDPPIDKGHRPLLAACKILYFFSFSSSERKFLSLLVSEPPTVGLLFMTALLPSRTSRSASPFLFCCSCPPLLLLSSPAPAVLFASAILLCSAYSCSAALLIESSLIHPPLSSLPRLLLPYPLPPYSPTILN